MDWFDGAKIMRLRSPTIAGFGALLLAPATATAQTAPATRATPPSTDAVPADIVVEGYRERPGIKTNASSPASVSTTRNRTIYAFSERVARCAARGRLAKLSRLHAVVDGAFNTQAQALAQDRLVRVNITCSEGSSLLGMTAGPQSDIEKGSQESPFYADAAPLGHSLYDRGAFTVQALRTFAPDLKLTPAQTNDPVVQSRFNLREVPRNRFRLPADYRYFETAVCMVRVEPRLAVRLAMSDGSARSSDLQSALIDRSRACVGGARNVTVDPTQFRLYIADAVYRWAVAARSVASLIPDDEVGSR